jgi:2-polyprenyl-3-methyl-5-hydroxy-6-metoxy-1,4-benzoquinol methylase
VTPGGARPRVRGPQEHYSYTIYADPAMADRFEQVRFGGPIGALLAETQERVLAEFAGPLEGRAVLDVGTGTGRAALALAARGGIITGVDASPEMLRVARERARARGLVATFTPGDAHALPFEARSFDVAVCLRVLMHTPDWARCVGELCRIARHRVVLDHPALLSAAALESIGRRAAAALGAHVEAYRVLPERAVRRELARHGFRVAAVHRQFVLPIALHRRLGSRTASQRIEAGLARAGLLRLLGSPVTVMAER